MSDTPVIPYHELSNGSGLSLQDGSLVAYLNNTELARVAAPDDDLASLLRDYRVLDAFADANLAFAHTPPREYKVEIVGDPISLDGEFSGRMTFTTEDAGIAGEHLWFATCQTSPVFQKTTSVPEGILAYPESSIEGWALHLSGPLVTHPDPVVIRRTALALEAFIAALVEERPINVPYRRGFNNVIDAQRPSWNVNLPYVVGPGARELSTFH